MNQNKEGICRGNVEDSVELIEDLMGAVIELLTLPNVQEALIGQATKQRANRTIQGSDFFRHIPLYSNQVQ